jgi:hypothetical protein
MAAAPCKVEPAAVPNETAFIPPQGYAIISNIFFIIITVFTQIKSMYRTISYNL